MGRQSTPRTWRVSNARALLCCGAVGDGGPWLTLNTDARDWQGVSRTLQLEISSAETAESAGVVGEGGARHTTQTRLSNDAAIERVAREVVAGQRVVADVARADAVVGDLSAADA